MSNFNPSAKIDLVTATWKTYVPLDASLQGKALQISRCPVPGCLGWGNVLRHKNAFHRTQEACPVAAHMWKMRSHQLPQQPAFPAVFQASPAAPAVYQPSPAPQMDVKVEADQPIPQPAPAPAPVPAQLPFVPFQQSSFHSQQMATQNDLKELMITTVTTAGKSSTCYYHF